MRRVDGAHEDLPVGDECGAAGAVRRRLSPAEKREKLRQRNAELSGVAAVEAAREVALRQLDARSRSREQLRRAIEDRGFSADVACEVLDRLEGVGLINDEAYARAIVADCFNGSGKTGRPLLEEMRRKGIDESVIADAMSAIDEGILRDKAADLARKKLRSMQVPSREVAYRRLSGMLARKGYSPSVCADVVRDVLADQAFADERGEWL